MKRFILFVFSILLVLGFGACTSVDDNNENELRDKYVLDVEAHYANMTALCDADSRNGAELISWFTLLLNETKEEIAVADSEDELKRLKNQFRTNTGAARQAYESDITRNSVGYKTIAYGEVDGKSFTVLSGEVTSLSSAEYSIRTTSSDPELQFKFVTDKQEFVVSGDRQAVTAIGNSTIDVLRSNDKSGYIGVIIKSDEKIYGVVDMGYHTDSVFVDFDAYLFSQDAWETVTEEQIVAALQGDKSSLPNTTPCAVEILNRKTSLGNITVKKASSDWLFSVNFGNIEGDEGDESSIAYEVKSTGEFVFNGEKVCSAKVNPGQTVTFAGASSDGISVVVKRGEQTVGVVVVSVTTSESGSAPRVGFVAYKLNFNADSSLLAEYPDLYDDAVTAIINCYSK